MCELISGASTLYDILISLASGVAVMVLIAVIAIATSRSAL
jgi:hypothetical protein